MTQFTCSFPRPILREFSAEEDALAKYIPRCSCRNSRQSSLHFQGTCCDFTSQCSFSPHQKAYQWLFLPSTRQTVFSKFNKSITLKVKVSKKLLIKVSS